MNCIGNALPCLLALLFSGSLSAETGAHPASMAELAIPSHGARINGFVYEAAGAGPHPTVLFLHGYPGNERNLDLAQAVRRAGYNAVYVDYRGNWGSGGIFTPSNALEDVQSVLAWMRRPENATKHSIDPERISFVGHSFGGWLALITASRDRSLQCVAAMAAWNLGWVGSRLESHPAEAKELRDYIAWSADPAGGPMRLDTDDFMQALGTHATEWNYASGAATLKDQRLLLVAATRDTPDEGVERHRELETAIKDAGGTRVDTLVYDDDHAFSSNRAELVDALVGWLKTNCR